MAHFDTTGLEDAAADLVTQGIDVVRIGYSDLIGTERGRDVLVNRFARTVGDGVAFCRSVYGTTPMGDVVDIEGGLDAGLPDVVAFPDLATLRPVPWEPGVAHCIADLFNPDGTPSAGEPAGRAARVVDQFAELGMTPDRRPGAGVLPARARRAAPTGWQRYGEAHRQRLRRRAARATRRTSCCAPCGSCPRYGLDVVAANHEFASGQFEINLWHSDGAGRRRPGLPLQGGGQGAGPAARTSSPRSWPSRSTTRAAPASTCTSPPADDDGAPLFDDPAGRVRAVRRRPGHAIAGILAHAPALAALLQPDDQLLQAVRPGHAGALADRLGAGQPQRDGPDPARARPGARLELRLGDASANPYLAIAGLLAAAHAGHPRRAGAARAAGGLRLRPDQGRRAARRPRPTALDALEADAELADVLGKPFVATFLAYKRNEIERFSALGHRLGVPRVRLPPVI